MADLDLRGDWHRHAPRRGAGIDDANRLAITLSGPGDADGSRIADIGCGLGASTLVLAQARARRGPRVRCSRLVAA